MSLSSDERKFLNADFETFESNSLRILKRLISFYDKFGIVYGKSKHGLSFMTGGSSNPINEEAGVFDNSVLNCFSRINNKDKIPKEHFVLSSFSSNPSMQYRYFNIISVLSFNTNLIAEIRSILSDLNELISFICTNHQSYALNCGKAYLPCSRRDNKLSLLTSRIPETENERQISQSIADKNFPMMYLPLPESIFNIQYTNQQIIESLTRNTITNIVIPETLTRGKSENKNSFPIQYQRKLMQFVRRIREFSHL